MRSIKGLTALATAVGIALAAPAGAVAAKGGTPPDNACGLGKTGSQDARASGLGPGASGFATESPISFGCTGGQSAAKSHHS